jgi:hypothetical protein
MAGGATSPLCKIYIRPLQQGQAVLNRASRRITLSRLQGSGGFRAASGAVRLKVLHNGCSAVELRYIKQGESNAACLGVLVLRIDVGPVFYQ